MLLDAMHPEDVKAELRKRFNTVKAFEEAHGLWSGAVHDLLRGNRSQRVEDAIVKAIAAPISGEGESRYSEPSRENSHSHRQKSKDI